MCCVRTRGPVYHDSTVSQNMFKLIDMLCLFVSVAVNAELTSCSLEVFDYCTRYLSCSIVQVAMVNALQKNLLVPNTMALQPLLE